MKTLRLLPIGIVLLAGLSSCTKNDALVIDNGNETITIHATIDPSTKTAYTDDKFFTWQDTDILRVFCKDDKGTVNSKWFKFTATTVNGSSAEFEGTITEGYTPVEVLCPGAALYGKNETGTAIANVQLNKSLDYTTTGASNLPLYAKIPDGVGIKDAELVFKPVCGMIKVTVKNIPLTASQFTITSADKNLYGTFPIVDGLISGDGEYAGKTVTVKFNQPETNGGNMDFFIPAVAATYGAGLSIELQTPDGVTIAGTKKTSTSSMDVVNGRMSRVSITLPDVESLYIPKEDYLVESAATSTAISFSASANWVANSSNSNFTLSSTSGTAGKQTLTVSYPKNSEATTKSTTITVTVGGVSKDITITQEAAVAKKVLSFDFTSYTNISDWPTSASATAAGNKAYSLGGDSYTFDLGANVYYNSSKYLILKATTYLGLPTIEGWKLSKIVISNTSGCSTKTKVSVYKEKTYTTLVKGGDEQTFGTQGSTYTYALSSTDVNTSYYLMVAGANCQIKTIELTYIQ